MVNAAFAEILTPLELAIKQLVRTDPVARRRLQGLQGKVIAVVLSSPSVTFYLLPVADGVEFSFSDHQADCTLAGSWIDFLEVAEDEHRLFSSKIVVQGDHQLAAELKSILTQLDIDWEGLMASHIGDLPAHQLAKLFTSSRNYAEKTSSLLFEDLSDYLHEELRIAPAKPELQQFYSAVDELRLRVDRLQARTQQLEKAQNPSSR